VTFCEPQDSVEHSLRKSDLEDKFLLHVYCRALSVILRIKNVFTLADETNCFVLYFSQTCHLEDT
jgi:hypothetical protein